VSPSSSASWSGASARTGRVPSKTLLRPGEAVHGAREAAASAQVDYEGMAALHPIGRIGEISDVVDGILYLEQAGSVTGETLHIDGGQAAGH
jgi:NAD(P)-dependent dehydrogenase (short-subunit alcohol dehydrogenase family)